MKNKETQFGIRPVSSKDIVGAGFTLVVGHLLLPFIPFDKAKDFRAFPDKKQNERRVKIKNGKR